MDLKYILGPRKPWNRLVAYWEFSVALNLLETVQGTLSEVQSDTSEMSEVFDLYSARKEDWDSGIVSLNTKRGPN